MRLATIDLGTNTVRLLVAEAESAARWRVVDQDQQVTRLGERLARGGTLDATAMERTAAVVKRYVDRARQRGADAVRIVATSAVREARNGRAFAADLERATGARVEIVSGEDEARLTSRGVLDGLGRPRGRLCIFDIGGGSTEYTLVHDGVVAASVSLALGVVALAERVPFPGPVERDRFEALRVELRAQLDRELPRDIVEARLDRLVGTAGTVTTLAALDLALATYDAVRVQGHRLTRAAILRQAERLGALTVTERAALPCLEPGRADLIVPGIAIVLATMDRFAVDELTVSDAGLREGMLSDAIERERR